MPEKDLNKEFVYNLFSKEEKLKNGISREHVVDLVDSLLFRAIKHVASDIHLEQTKNDLRVRYRIDGILYDQDKIQKELALSVISRLKILSSLDISEKRIPQDGKFCVKINRNLLNELPKKYDFIDMRVSTFPSINGEKIVIRILDRSKNKIHLEKLGMDNQTLKNLYSIIDRPQGFFLVTGPTGSGKTTTLYSILSYLNNSERNIVTMEDPVEYNIDGITQSQINEKAGFTFETGLRSILRQDPDVIMVGEVRDKQTAQIAIESALTGHLVLSTLHTNDSIGAVTRLLDMGVEPFLISASLSGVLAQRLVRNLCNRCKKKSIISSKDKQILNDLGLDMSITNLENVFVSNGCSNCLNLGYKSRTGIFELLKIDDELRDLINLKASIDKIKAYSMHNKMNFLIQDGMNKVNQGLISLEELLRYLIT